MSTRPHVPDQVRDIQIFNDDGAPAIGGPQVSDAQLAAVEATRELGALLLPLLRDGRRAVMRIASNEDWERARRRDGNGFKAIIRDEISGRRFEILRVSNELLAIEVL